MMRGDTGSPFQTLKRAALCAAFFVAGQALQAQTVTLRDADGAVFAEGEVLSYDGRYLRLMAAQGALTLDYGLFTCAGEACPDAATFVPLLRLSGAARLGELILPALVEGYARDRNWLADRTEEGPSSFTYALREGAEGPLRLRFAFRVTTTDDGFADLLAEEADLVMASRELTPDELARAEEAGLGDLRVPGQVRVLALDALAPVTGPGIARTDISVRDLAGILAGEVTDWAELGEPPQRLTLHLAEVEAGQVQALSGRVLGPFGLTLSERGIMHPDLTVAEAAISTFPGAVGLLPFDALGATRPLAISGDCPLLLNARPEAIRTADYPLSVPLLLYLPQRRLPEEAMAFLRWIRTTEAQLVLRRAGVLGLDAAPVPLSLQGDRLAAAIEAAGAETSLAELQRMVGFMRTRVRLTPTFRFGEGATGLDSVSAAQVVNLAQAILDGDYAGRDLVLVGFSDSAGPARANLRLSAARAETVRRRIVEALDGRLPEDVGLRTEAFGEALPVACDDTLLGRQANRRVELWVGAPD